MIVHTSDRPSKEPTTTLLETSGDFQYIGKANGRSTFPQTLPTITPTAGSPTTVDFASAHGLVSGNEVIISGLTGNWTPLNGSHVVTVTDSDSLTIAVDSTLFGAVTGTAVVETYAPLTINPVWAIERITSAAGVPVAIQHASAGMSNKWSERATLAYN